MNENDNVINELFGTVSEETAAAESTVCMESDGMAL